MKSKISNTVFISVLLLGALLLSNAWYKSLCQPMWDFWSDTPNVIEKRDVPYITIGERYYS